jgi:hypothetical protein
MITLLSMEVGFRAGRRIRQRLAGEKIQAGPLVAACLSLLAFMLAMTFGNVQSRFQELKQVALDEANAIGTAYLRADLLPGADRAQVQQLLRDYVNLRLETVEDGAGQQVEQAIAKSRDLQKALWLKAATIADQTPTDISVLFVESVNQMIDLHQTRITLGLQFHLPEIVWLVLYGLIILAMGMGGYANGYSGSRRSITLALAMASAYSVVLMLVVGMDRTEKHLSTVTQLVMMDLQECIRSSTGTQP